MFMYEIIKPLTVYSFEFKDGNICFSDLEKEVRENNGFVERKADDLVVITVPEGVFTLPLGFAVVINNGIGRILKVTELYKNYVKATEISEAETDYAKIIKELGDLASRVGELETQSASKEAKGKKETKKEVVSSDVADEPQVPNK